MSACAPSGGPDYIKECIIPEDQTGTFEGRWAATPIPIALKSGDFDTEETADIVKAAEVWNGFFKATQNIQILNYGENAESPNQSTASIPQNLCGTGIIQQGKFSGQVVIYKKSKWTKTDHNAIALTNFCAHSATPRINSRMFMAIMEVNYQDFFVSGKKLPDLTSIFIHEFGHLLGLDHSCETKTKTGMPLCNSSLDRNYFYAIMYPSIIFDSIGVGQQRRELQSNDQGRANCLYTSATTD